MTKPDFRKKHENPNFMTLGLLVALENADKVYPGFLILDRHVLSWPKLGLEPKFYESGTFGGFGKREQSFIRYPADI